MEEQEQDYEQIMDELNKEWVGKKVELTLRTLVFHATITAVRKNFGRIDALIKPVSGSGKMWRSVDKLTLIT